MKSGTVCGWLCIGLVVVSKLPFAHADDSIDYVRQIKPLLLHKCASCHGALQQKSGLRVDTATLLVKGGDGGAIVVPGDSAKSRLIEIVSRTGDIKMPPEGDGTPLTTEEISLLRKWIDSGAKGPEDEKPQTDPRDWWSYRPITKPTLPAVKRADWVRTPVDAFLAAKHEELGLAPVGETDRATWLRRVHLDLVGLPPTRAELHAFVADQSADAFEKVVDDLLKRPQYGERWGRHWMDVWRYSDWYGSRGINEIRYSQRHIWRWRDWIVDSLNDDKPYDRMIVEMLAADEVAPTDAKALAATGFIGRNWYKFDRNVWMFDLVEHTGQAFLGLTLKCARCHDHKFDPVSQEEYYRFRAFFEPHDVRTDRLFAATETEKDATLGLVLKDGVARVYDKQPDVKTFLFQRGDNRYPDESKSLSPGVPSALRGELTPIAAVSLPVEAYYPSLRPELADGLIQQAQLGVAKVEKEIEAAREKATLLEAKFAAIVPSPPSSGERARVRRPSGENALSDSKAPTSTPLDNTKPSDLQAPPHPNPLPPKSGGEGTKPAAMNAFHYRDDFARERPEDWKPISGQWVYENNRLVEKAVTSFATMLLNKTLPKEVRIRVKYRPLAAAGLRSVGFSFDYIDQGNSQDVYTHTGDSSQSVQAFHRTGGQQVYPAIAIVQTKDLKVGEEATIEITARGQQLTLMLNGTKRLDYVMPIARREGKFALWVHNGSAEFLELDIKELVPSPDDLRREIDLAQDAVGLLGLKRATALAEVESLRARIAAERAKYSLTEGPNAGLPERMKIVGLTLAAGRAENAVAVSKATETMLQAEHNLTQVRPSLRSIAESDFAADALLYENSPAAIDAEHKFNAAKAAFTKAAAALELPANSYTPVGDVFPSTSTGRRTALAHWIASKQNPRTARVAVNHIWLRHFGQPLVASVANFGLNGDQPTHPELLDWLAAELMENSWKMKPIHRAIVLSAGYRMRSSITPLAPALRGEGTGVQTTLVPSPPSGTAALGGRARARVRGPNDEQTVPTQTAEKTTPHPNPLPSKARGEGTRIDPTNKFFWHFPSRRMEAEVVRDSVLFAAGSLDLNRGGPEIPEAQAMTSARRSLYFRNTPNEKAKFLELFDVADPNGCYRRRESVVPQQALALMNSALALDQTRLLAEKLTKEVGEANDEPTNTAFITAAFEAVLNYSPSEAELSASRIYLRDHAELTKSSQPAVFPAGGQSQRGPSASPAQRARENLVHVLFSHNAFVTVR